MRQRCWAAAPSPWKHLRGWAAPACPFWEFMAPEECGQDGGKALGPGGLLWGVCWGGGVGRAGQTQPEGLGLKPGPLSNTLEVTSQAEGDTEAWLATSHGR